MKRVKTKLVGLRQEIILRNFIADFPSIAISTIEVGKSFFRAMESGHARFFVGYRTFKAIAQKVQPLILDGYDVE